MWRALSPMRDFMRTETAGGVLLVSAALAALVWANSPWKGSYESLWHSVISIDIAGHELSLDLRHWLNDAAMAIFFLVVGLEIKREVTSGHLAGRRAATLPIAAAFGGMLVPALIYLAIAGGTNSQGWGVPMATDIALAVGVVTLAGDSVPASLRAFLLGLAVVDDIGAIVVIAIFYSDGVSFAWLLVGVSSVVVTLLVRRSGLQLLPVYIALGALLWFALHEAGVHPTLAGVTMGLLTPVTPRRSPDLVDADRLAMLPSVENVRETMRSAKESVSTVEWLEYHLHPWTSFLIVPIFALANSGVEVSVSSLEHALGSPITWGVFAGLIAGKPIGVLLTTRIAFATGAADRLSNVSRRQYIGAGHAAGIGFTVALFISELAFDDQRQVDDAKMAILTASILSGIVAFFVLRQRPKAAAAAATIAPSPVAVE